MDEFYLIAEIRAIHNKEGFLSIVSYTDVPERFNKLRKVYIEIFGEKKEFFIEKVLHLKNSAAVKFRNFDSDKDVSFLIGKKMFVDNESLVKLSENTYFIHDLIGSSVFRNNAQVGLLTDVLVLPANDVYVITETSGKELLIPAIKDYIESFDPQNKILVIKPGDDIYDEEFSDKDDED